MGAAQSDGLVKVDFEYVAFYPRAVYGVKNGAVWIVT